MIEKFRENHKSFFNRLLDDTWLCEKKIEEEEVVAVWEWCLRLGEESIRTEDFEKTFKVSFKDLTN